MSCLDAGRQSLARADSALLGLDATIW